MMVRLVVISSWLSAARGGSGGGLAQAALSLSYHSKSHGNIHMQVLQRSLSCSNDNDKGLLAQNHEMTGIAWNEHNQGGA